ncbi:MAG: MBL fold metallo-hydrolase [Gemmatimonadota bacterium]
MVQLEEVAPDLFRLAITPLDLTNVYLLDDVLVDAGASFSAGRILAALEGRTVRAVALTHGHFDHQGGAHAVCEALGSPLLCGEGERAAVERGDASLLYPDPSAFVARLAKRLAGPAHAVERTLREGDEVGGFRVVETPGHTRGHLAFWRERDRTLVLGDVLFHRNPLTTRKGLAEPYRFLVWDHDQNRVSLQRLSQLEPELVCFGHGRPLRDPARFRAFAAERGTPRASLPGRAARRG